MTNKAPQAHGQSLKVFAAYRKLGDVMADNHSRGVSTLLVLLSVTPAR